MFRWMTMAALTGALAAPAQAETLEGPVMQVIDGNNIVIAGMVIRLDGLAAPGVHEARGDDAAYIMEMIVHDSGGAFRCELSGERLWERHIDNSLAVTEDRECLPAAATVLDILGQPHDSFGMRGALAAVIAKKPSNQQTHLMACVALWEQEATIDKQVWRHDGNAAYLKQLEAWGYTLSEAEKVTTGDLTEEAAYQALSSE